MPPFFLPLARFGRLHYSSPREAVKMLILASALGTLSGLRFVAPELESTPAVMITTAIAVQITHAIICRFFAAQRGRNGFAWGLAGLLGGVLTVTALLVVIERQQD